MEKRREVAVRVQLMSLLASIAAYLCPAPNTFAAPLERLHPTITLSGEPPPDVSVDGPAEIDLSIMRVTGYVDQYLNEGSGAEEWYGTQATGMAGRRSINTELVYYRNSSDVFGDSTEVGIWTHWTRETRNFGQLDAEFVFSDLEIDYIGRQRKSSDMNFTLRQSGAPIADHWTMNNTLGIHRTPISSLLNGGYRVRLSTSPLLGLSGQLINTNKDITWFTGKTGHFEGSVLRQFEEDGGKLTGGAYQHEVAQQFWLGGEVVTFSGNDLVREHTSMLAAGQYARPDRSMEYNVHLLADDDSNFGLWADGMQYLPASYQLRYGIFYLQPELAWMDRPISNNQAGFYLRTDKQSFRSSFSAGYDYLETGLENRDFLPGTNTHWVFLNDNFRVNRKLTLGLNVNLALRRIDSAQTENQTYWRLNNFLFYNFPIGTSRFELYASALSSDLDTNGENRQGLRVSHDWRMPQSLRLTTEVRLEETERFGKGRSFREGSILFRHDIADNWNWGVNTSVYTESGERSSYNGFGIDLDTRWDFLPNWHASLSLLYNAYAVEVSDFELNNQLVLNDNPKSNSVWLTVGYGKSSGQPLMSFGRNNGAVGSGQISGVIFYDENQDFVRQPGEKPAAGIVVLLDGRYEAMTDSEGRYSFDPVYTGVHRVALITEDLPLPWSMHDETPRRVEVNLRRTGEVDFPLVRIN